MFDFILTFSNANLTAFSKLVWTMETKIFVCPLCPIFLLLDFLGEIFLNATIAATQLSITVPPLLPPAAPCSHRQAFDPVRILCWNYLERLSYAQVGSKKHEGLGLSSPSSLAHEESLSVVRVDEAKNTKDRGVQIRKDREKNERSLHHVSKFTSKNN